MALNGKKIAFLVAPEGVEQVELTEPWKPSRPRGRSRSCCRRATPGRPRPSTTSTGADTFDVDLPVGRAGVED